MALAVLGGFIAGSWTVVAPRMMGSDPPGGATTAILSVAVAGYVIGLTWMVRIYRSDPEPDQHAWRYRERG